MPDEPRWDRDDDDAADEAGRDFDALGTLDDVHDGGVDKHRRYDRKHHGAAPPPGVVDRQGYGDGR